MVRTLLDTCVLSEIRKPSGEEAVKRAVLEIADEDIFISVITIGEIVKGIELLKPGKQKHELQQWLKGIEFEYPKAILEINLETVRIWGMLTATAQKIGQILPISDALIAATARQHDLRVMTRNKNDFERTGVSVIDPWPRR